jgi:hypothetical protein
VTAAPVAVAALLGFILGSLFGVHVSVRVVQWASKHPQDFSADIEAILERQRREER